MKKMLVVALVFTVSLFADWELSSRDLKSMIKEADVIVEGKFTSYKKIKVLDAIKGPQKLRKIKLSQNAVDIKLKRDYILFFQLQGDVFTLLAKNTINSDVLIKSRIREEVMKVRVAQSTAVVNAKVLETHEILLTDNKKYTVATCELTKIYKGECSKIFEVMYRSDRQKKAKRVFLFPKLTYVFFLNEQKNRSTIYSWNIKNMKSFVQAISAKTSIAKRIRKSLSKKALKILPHLLTKNASQVERLFFEELNKSLRKKSMYTSTAFPNITVPKEWQHQQSSQNIALTNCLILNKKYSQYFNTAINSFSMAPYDGAIIDRHYVLKEVTKASSVNSRFEDMAGKAQSGLKIFGQSGGSSFSTGDTIAINLLVQNLSKSEVTICNSHIPYLLGVNVVNIDKNKLVLDNGLKPFKKMEKSFVKLQANRYIVIPTLDLRDYYSFTPGKYGVYIQLYVPVSYAQERSDAWIGKILTNFIEFEIK
ncbi:hypothetical protein [Candidatus Uabimicrobium sp. HlEnr_7]|uniref:hypothetical protein n=1 Tax=Candidatus Uabimicrobium helgolandensis TaxID=3095367 RepID=UPI0035584A83